MGLKDLFRKWGGGSVTVDYSAWEDDRLLATWRERQQLTTSARALLTAEIEGRGLSPKPRPPEADDGDSPVDQVEEVEEVEASEAALAAAEAAEAAEDAADGGGAGALGEAPPRLELVTVTSAWSLALWAGDDEYTLVVFPPRDDGSPQALVAPIFEGDERVTSVVVVDPLDHGWSPSSADLERLGVSADRVWRLGGVGAPPTPRGAVAPRALPTVLDLGQLRFDTVLARGRALRARWNGIPTVLLLGPRLTAELISSRPHATHLVGGIEPLDEASQKAWAARFDPAALAVTKDAVVLAGARDVEPASAQVALPQLGVSVTVIGPRPATPEGGAADAVLRAALADDWDTVRERVGALEDHELEELFEAQAIEGRVDRVERLGALLSDQDPERGLAWFLRGAVASMTGDDDASLAHYRRAVAAGRPEPRAWANLASVLAERGDLDEALATVEQGLERLPGDEVIRTTHVLVLRNRGDVDGARAALARHHDVLAEATRVHLERLIDRPVEAEDRRPRRRWPHLAVRACHAARELLKSGALDAAERVLRRAIELDRLSEAQLEVTLDVGAALLGKKIPGRAIALYDVVLDTFPNAAPLRHNRGNALLALGRFEEAAEEYRRCVAVFPQWGDPRVNLVSVLTRLGRFDEAAKELDVLEKGGVDTDLVMALDGQIENAMAAAGIDVDDRA